MFSIRLIFDQLKAAPLLSLFTVPAFATENARDNSRTIVVTASQETENAPSAQEDPKAISEITSDFIRHQAPTMNAFQLVRLLPAANVATTDPYGLSADNSITMRGLGQDAITMLMEGAPQNNLGYYYAYPSQFSDSENISKISLIAGAVDMDTPAIAGAGGLLSLSLKAPKNESAALLSLSVGSYQQRRAFLRLDSGNIGNSGLKAFVSYSFNRADNWRGAGFDNRHHVDAKLLYEWGQKNSAGLSLSFNEANTSLYPSPTLSQWQKQGRDFNLSSTYEGGDSQYWRLYRAPFRSIYFAAPVQVKFNDQISLDSSSYLQFGYGNSPYGTELNETGNFLGTEEITQPIRLPGAQNGVATVLGNWTGDQFRVGNVSSVKYETGRHKFVAGFWLDYGRDRVFQTYTPIHDSGRPYDGWGRPSLAIRTPDGRLLAYENQRTQIFTKSLFLGDSITLDQKLHLDLGLKMVHFLRKGKNFLPGPQHDVRFSSLAFLPRAALHLRLDDRHQFFANIATSFRAPNEFTLYNSYFGGEIVSSGSTNLKNEYSTSKELGYRFASTNFSASLTAYLLQFRNRQVPTVINSGGALVNSTVNAGGQTSYGLDAEASARLGQGFSIYLSGAYLHTQNQSDLPIGGDWLPTKGKRAIASPTFQFGLGSQYDDGRLFGSAGLKYVSRQYSTFMNDEWIKPYANLDLSIGVHLQGLLDGQKTDIRFNALNVTNPRILSGIQMLSANATDQFGRNDMMIEGSAPTYYIGSGRAFTLTISREM